METDLQIPPPRLPSPAVAAPTPPAASVRGFAFSDPRARRGLYAICFGFFLVLLDTSALNVAVVAMEREFGGPISRLQWVVNSYTLVFAAFLLTCGAIGDRIGARRCYQAGLLLFSLMSMACALSPGPAFLIAARAFQGLGAAIMLPASLALLSHTFPNPDERARAVAFWAGVVSLGFAAGPALGGLLITFAGWRSIFWVNVPIGLAAIFLVRRYITEARSPYPRPIDWPGQAAAALTLFALSYGLIQAGESGWTAPPVLLAFLLSILFAAAFALSERFSASPVLPRVLFANATFSVSIAIGLILNFGMYGILFIVPIYLQASRHLSPLATGMVILPFTVLPTITTRAIVAFSTRRYIRSRLFLGLLVSAIGAGALALAPVTPGYWAVLFGLGLLGIGMGCTMPAMTAGVLTASSAETSGLASGILNSARQVGGAIGVALLGTLAQAHHGYLWSFLLTVVVFALMAVFTMLFIAPPE
jgi:DHA2 family methylenomycin A resistance protein-like MFS transporter